MKVRDLIERLSKMDPETRVVCAGFDHSYRDISLEKSRAEDLGKGRFNEYHGPEHVQDENNAIIDVLVIA